MKPRRRPVRIGCGRPPSRKRAMRLSVRGREVGVDEPVSPVVGRDGEAEQAALAGAGVDARHAHHDPLAPPVGRDAQDAAGGALADERVPARQEGDAPRDLEPGDDRAGRARAGALARLGAAGDHKRDNEEQDDRSKEHRCACWQPMLDTRLAAASSTRDAGLLSLPPHTGEPRSRGSRSCRACSASWPGPSRGSPTSAARTPAHPKERRGLP